MAEVRQDIGSGKAEAAAKSTKVECVIPLSGVVDGSPLEDVEDLGINFLIRSSHPHHGKKIRVICARRDLQV